MKRLKLILYLIEIATFIVVIHAHDEIGQDYEFEDNDLEDFDERQYDYSYWYTNYGDYGGSFDARGSCKDSYPTNYFKKCNTKCSKLAKKGSCSKKWKAVTSGSCQNKLKSKHLKQKVKAWCLVSCDQCANGGYATWSSWGSCSVTCAGGTQTRTRTCTNPKAFGGGTECSGCSGNPCTQTATQDCNPDPCPINGNYTEWGEWGSCSKTCEDDAVRVRERNCTNPAPQYGGDNCTVYDYVKLVSGTNTTVGENETEACNEGIPCPVDGMWGEWGNWTTCSETCGGGNQTRIRLCDDPAAAHGGATCTANASYTESVNGSGIQQQEAMQSCNEQPCHIDGLWGDWGPWGSCSVTCANGTEYRTRLCDDPMPQFGGANCTSNASLTEMWSTLNNTLEQTDSQACDPGPCPIDGNWGEWGNWTDCSKTCFGGTTNRTRTCSDPAPQYGGVNCTDSTVDTVSGDGMVEYDVLQCNVFPCDTTIFCMNMNQDYKTDYGKCGEDYGRCNPAHSSKFLYCDLSTNECHNDLAMKTAQANDYYDAYPLDACTTPCGPNSDPKAGVTSLNSCASTGGTRKGRSSAAKCWAVCSKNNGKYGITVSGIIWKKGTCGCITDAMMGQCEVNTEGEGFEYYEVTPTCTP